MQMQPLPSAGSTCTHSHRRLTQPAQVGPHHQHKRQQHNSLAAAAASSSQPSNTTLQASGPASGGQQQQQQGRRQLLLGGSTAALLAAGGWVIAPPSHASVTLTLRPKPQLKPYTLKAGYSVTVPDTWSLAYDRSTDDKAVVQAFFGNFKTVETLGISKLAKPEGDLSPQQLLDWVLSEQKNNQSTYDFQLLSGNTPTPRTAPAADTADGSPAAEDTYYDSEYLLAICRGGIQEGAGGRRRCIGPRDMDLEVVSRTFYQSFVVRPDNIYVIRGSSTTQQWQDVRAAAQHAVQSFRMPASLQ